MAENDTVRQIIRGYMDREIVLENQLKEMPNLSRNRGRKRGSAHGAKRNSSSTFLRKVFQGPREGILYGSVYFQNWPQLSRPRKSATEEGDFFKIRREQFEKQKKIAKKRNETFLKDLEHTTAKLRASLACDDLTDKKLDAERNKFLEYIRQIPTRDQSS